MRLLYQFQVLDPPGTSLTQTFRTGGPMPFLIAFLAGFIVGTAVGEHHRRNR